MGGVRDAVLKPQRVIPVLRVVARHDWSSRLLTKALAPYNPLDPRRYADPYPAYDELRARGPIFFHKRTGVWLVSGHAECEAVLRAPSTVERGPFLRALRPYSQLSTRPFDVLSGMIIGVDPPDHTRLRNLVSRAFTPRAIANLEPEIRRVCDDLLDDLDGHETVDVFERYATRLPIYIIGSLLGLPSDQWQDLKRLSDVIARFIDPLLGFDPAEMDAAVSELGRIVSDLAEERRCEPADDVLSALVEVESDGDRLSEVELHSMITLLMVAGHETTTGLIANSLIHLDRNRDARETLRERPEIAANAVEELLRFDAPVQNTDRFPTEDIVIGGHEIPEGANVIVLFGAANRDPRVHDGPDELRLDRERPRPLSFGHGIHHCVGAALARLEAKVAIPAFVERFPDYSVIENDIVWKRSVTLHGPSHLPVALGSRETHS